ncbi:hypothetical protein Cni_G27445 [Canna indica]|uniref:Uncharacterized protein n=1 Tax=Canna indica TaxID=4628 RepID=A0AAQ3L0S8_9LILI|nr:hypothetical protein Cni_G27445 [Canna indica]
MDARAAATSNKERLLNQLVLYAPLISTRRSSSSVSTNSVGGSNSARRPSAPSSSATQRVPFSWESSPGVPKFSRQGRLPPDVFDDEQPLPLPPKLLHNSGEDDSTFTNVNVQVNLKDELDAYKSSAGSDDNDDDDDDIFSDALEKISLSEKFDLACRLSSFNDMALHENDRNVPRSPSFIMNRFLPAANALANSSFRNDGVHLNRRAPSSSSSSYDLQKEVIKARIKHRASVKARLQVPFDPYVETRTELPSMACGLMLFFPWSFKPTVCGFKSPARSQGTPRPGLSSLTPKNTVKGCNNGLSSDRFKPTVVCGFKSPARSRTPRPDLTSSSPKRTLKGCGDEWSTDSFEATSCGFKSPARRRTSKPPDLASSSSPKRCSDGWSSDVEDNGGGGAYVEKLSVKVNHSNGWGLSFIDTSRLRSKARDVEKWKSKARRLGIGIRERNQKERHEQAVVPESRRAAWRLPQLTSPSESWLSHALSSINRKL